MSYYTLIMQSIKNYFKKYYIIIDISIIWNLINTSKFMRIFFGQKLNGKNV